MIQDYLAYGVLAAGAVTTLIGLYFSARPGTPALGSMKNDIERGCLFAVVGIALLFIGSIIKAI